MALVIHVLIHNPRMMKLRVSMGQDTFAHLITMTFPIRVSEMPGAPWEGDFFVSDPNRKPGEPEFVVTRLDHVLPPKAINVLYSAFKKFMATRPKSSGKLIREEARTDTEKNTFFHVGSWSKCCSRMVATRDTIKQSPASKAALVNLLQKLQAVAIPRVAARLRQCIPTHFHNTDQ